MYLNRLLVLLQANRQDLATRTSAQKLEERRRDHLLLAYLCGYRPTRRAIPVHAGSL